MAAISTRLEWHRLSVVTINLIKGKHSIIKQGIDMPSASRPEIDELCFQTCSLIKEYFKEAAQLYGGFGNIFALFFHDLVIHFTGLILHRNALAEYVRSEPFPWVDTEYARNPSVVSIGGFSTQSGYTSFRQRVHGAGLFPVAHGLSIPLGYRRNRVAGLTLKVLLPHALQRQAYLPNQASQINSLDSLVRDLGRLVDAPNREVICQNWLAYAKRHTTSRESVLKEKGILLGTRNNLLNRIHAINYQQQGKCVVGFTHGEITNAVFDEPVFGYSDKTLCTVLVDYGSFNARQVDFPAIIKPGKVVRRSSPVIASTYDRASDIEYRELARSRNLYIPTVYQGSCLYGPTHAYESETYYQWHLNVAKCLPNMTIKVHPKTRIQREFPCDTESRQLDDCIGDYDVLIFDFFSTASVLSIFTDKPVIYFDIGLRRLDPDFAAALARRCTVINIDFEQEWEAQIHAGLAEYADQRKTASNLELAQYSITKGAKFSLRSTIMDIIR